MNKTFTVINSKGNSFTIHDVVSLVKSGECDKVDICLAPPNDLMIMNLTVLTMEVMKIMEIRYLLHKQYISVVVLEN